MNLAIRSAAILAFAIAPGVHAAQTALVAGAWDVSLAASGATPACTPSYRAIPGVFILNSALVVPAGSNISKVLFIYGSSPLPQDARPLAPNEQKTKQLTLTQDEMKKAVAGGQVRIIQESLALAGGSTGADINLADMQTVLAAIGQCKSMLAAASPQRQVQQPTSVGLCSADLVQRMFAVQLTPDKVSQICGAQLPASMIPGGGSAPSVQKGIAGTTGPGH